MDSIRLINKSFSRHVLLWESMVSNNVQDTLMPQFTCFRSAVINSESEQTPTSYEYS